MLIIKNIIKKFGDLKVLDNFSYNIKKGKITALVGPNGAGKTTLFNIITGMLKNNNGIILLNNKNITNKETNKISQLGVSRMFQQAIYFKNLTIKEHLLLCFEDKRLISNLFNKHRLRRMRLIKDILKLIELSKSLDSLVVELSYGQKKLLSLAMALLRPHKILLLDEPVAGVNPLLKRKIKEILLKLKEKGKTIFLIEHDISFVKEVADEVIVLNNGKILDSGDPKKVFKNNKVIEAYIGT